MTISAVQPQASLLATVAHELRGPLGALEPAAEILDRDFDLLDQQQVRVMVSAIHRRALWLHGLMENLLCAATVDDGQLRVHLRPLNLFDVIQDATLLVEPLLKRRGQRLKVRTSPTVPLVSADSQRLTQVLLNLVSNAAKYAGTDTLIEVVLALREGRVRVTVADRGPGVPRDKVAQLFEAYNRAGRTDGEGLGIGLSVVRSIVNAHGGQVGFANRRGGGATFWFELPALAGSLFRNDDATERKRVG
jgi:two-component system sensor histidine kinase KdpD